MPGSKSKISYVCEKCGTESAKWEGRCHSCDEWNTMVEITTGRYARGDSGSILHSASGTIELSEVSLEEVERLSFSSKELNRVLGKGAVPGSAILIAGDPGIGKSTLLLKMASDIASSGKKTLYVTGEESMGQIKIRAERLGISGKRLVLLHTSELNEIITHLGIDIPDFIVVDSIQTIHSDVLESVAGSLGQIRECARVLMEWGKVNNVPVIFSGHVTKSGDIAGPKVLEHMVDVVLYMEGETVSAWRLLRVVKNRFGSTNEVGVFEMTEKGLVDVLDPSSTFIEGRTEGTVGSVVVATLDGSRPILIEVQALTSPSSLSVPRRVATGVDISRLLLIMAVLTKKEGLSLYNQDVVVNVTGGFKITEPAADLGVAIAIASSLRNMPVFPKVVLVGEIGLTGEIRKVPQMDRRLDEVDRLGFSNCVAPIGSGQISSNSVSVVPVGNVSDALLACFPNQSRTKSLR